MWAGLPSARRRSVVPTARLDPPGVIRRSHAACRARLSSALRDGPKTTANAGGTLKWTIPPPRRRIGLSAAANFPRFDRSRTAFHRHTIDSSHRTRGQRPQVIELPRDFVQSEPKLEPWNSRCGLPRDFVQSEPKLEPWNSRCGLPRDFVRSEPKLEPWNSRCGLSAF